MNEEDLAGKPCNQHHFSAKYWEISISRIANLIMESFPNVIPSRHRSDHPCGEDDQCRGQHWVLCREDEHVVVAVVRSLQGEIAGRMRNAGFVISHAERNCRFTVAIVYTDWKGPFMQITDANQ